MSNEAPLSFEASAFQCFVRGIRSVWRDSAYRATVSTAEQTIQQCPGDLAQLERVARQTPGYQLYAWLERHSQQLKYEGRWGIVRWMDQRKEQLDRILKEASLKHSERLLIDPDFKIPDYVLQVDTHQHKDGLWSDACDAFAYETSTKGFTFSLFDSQLPLKVYTDRALALVPNAQHILDLGCTIGGSTRALARAFKSAKVTGIDVCQPPLKLAHLRSLEENISVYWRQSSAEVLIDANESIDLVASHWLYHEMPPVAIRQSLKEARRVLRKGGGFMAYDMYLIPGGEIGQWLHHGYASRNNEPFAAAYAGMDMKKELEGVGFSDVNIQIVHPVPSEQVQSGALPPMRTHYMTMITARAIST